MMLVSFLGWRSVGTTCLALFASATLSTGCRAATGDQETWRCNSPNGHFNQNVLPVASGTVTSVHGRISIHDADKSGPWGAVARVAFGSSGSSEEHCSCDGLLVRAFHNPDVVEFHLVSNGQVSLVARARFETPITFDVSVDPQGMMTMKVGKPDPVVKTAMIPAIRRDSVVLSCSGTDVSFLGVTTH